MSFDRSSKRAAAAAALVMSAMPVALGSAAAAEPLPKGDPCRLLTDGEVRKFYPKASAGQRERTREKYGIVACVWDHPVGKLVAQVTLGAQPGSSMEEAQGIAIGFLDPLKPASRKAVRYEKVTGVGDEAVGVVERGDEKQGVLNDAAYLYTQRGDQQLLIIAVDLARGDRAAALKTLQEIGRTAAARL
ncbi:MAG TPA: hypothetical protein PKA20_02860 [Burkholderiaceae bacterium]|nr:hypothetical protein [Burkholderiaceae bacterium]